MKEKKKLYVQPTGCLFFKPNPRDKSPAKNWVALKLFAKYTFYNLTVPKWGQVIVNTDWQEQILVFEIE